MRENALIGSLTPINTPRSGYAHRCISRPPRASFVVIFVHNSLHHIPTTSRPRSAANNLRVCVARIDVRQ